MLSALAVAPIFFVWKASIDGLAVLGYRRDEVRFTCMADYGPTP